MFSLFSFAQVERWLYTNPVCSTMGYMLKSRTTLYDLGSIVECLSAASSLPQQEAHEMSIRCRRAVERLNTRFSEHATVTRNERLVYMEGCFCAFELSACTCCDALRVLASALRAPTLNRGDRQLGFAHAHNDTIPEVARKPSVHSRR